MKKLIPLLLIASMFAVACSPAKQYIAAVDTLATTIDQVSDARQAGKISDAQYRRVDQAIEIADEIRKQWKIALTDGSGGLRLANFLAAFRDALIAIKDAGGLK